MIELATVDIDFINYRLVYKSGNKIKMPRYSNNEMCGEVFNQLVREKKESRFFLCLEIFQRNRYHSFSG